MHASRLTSENCVAPRSPLRALAPDRRNPARRRTGWGATRRSNDSDAARSSVRSLTARGLRIKEPRSPKNRNYLSVLRDLQR